ncbi:MAG: metallopeptidase family protein [Planctomycetota bacterium]
MENGEPGEELDAAEALLDEGRPEEALAVLARVDPGDPDRWLLELDAWTELADWRRAEAALAAAERTNAPGEPLVDFYRGRLRLAQWRTAEARAALERVPVEVGGAALLLDLALLEDLEGDPAAADARLAAAAALDPAAAPPPIRLSPADFAALVEEAAAALPPDFRDAFHTVAVVIDPMPTAGIVDAPRSGHPPDLLGLFAGLPLTEREARGHGELPPTIFLFQRNLERLASDRARLREEVRTTLYHELGHALGFDEEGVEDMGLA